MGRPLRGAEGSEKRPRPQSDLVGPDPNSLAGPRAGHPFLARVQGCSIPLRLPQGKARQAQLPERAPISSAAPHSRGHVWAESGRGNVPGGICLIFTFFQTDLSGALSPIPFF